MCKGRIIVAGLGPGSAEDITPAVTDAIKSADVIVAYKYYFRFIEQLKRDDALCIDSGMRKEKERAEEAFRYALEGKDVVVVSSGDAGIYGMAPLIYEMRKESGANLDIRVLPGISAFQKAASLLGAPIGHDICIISLSDLMTPWAVIENRIRAASMGDFVTAVYNPRSHERYWQLPRLREIFLDEGRSPDTPVGIVRQAGRPEENVVVTTLGAINVDNIDMFTLVLIGNSQSYISDGKIVTPRGYYSNENTDRKEDVKVGQEIMIESFRSIEKEMTNPSVPSGRKWALLHAIHTTADFDMENILYTDEMAVEQLYSKVMSGDLKTIVTDVSMVKSGIRKGALSRLGIRVECFLSDPRVEQMTKDENITRTQAGIRLAVEEYPDALFAFGNAPTALMELCSLIRKGKAKPAGVIAAPVGFVHVRESKYMIKALYGFPKIIVEGRKGGSNLAATLCNSILTFDDAKNLWPGRDL